MSAHLTSSRPLARALVGGGVAIVLALTAACSDDIEGNVVADVLEDDGLPTQPAAPVSAAGEECVEPVDPTEFEGKPEVEMPVGEVPTELATDDIVVGEGDEAVEGKQVTLNYVGVACSTGVEFDTSWAEDREPLSFVIGPDAAIIQGWNEGIPGMKVGGVRRLIIPAEMGYGATGSGTDIAPDEALVFVVELVEVSDPPADAEGEVPAEGDGTEGDGTEGGDVEVPADEEAPADEDPPADGDDATAEDAESEG